jgi:hypothetical protein
MIARLGFLNLWLGICCILGSFTAFAAARQFPVPAVDSVDYGRWVDIDGDTAVVTSYLEATALGPAVGAVYVFRRTGETWTGEAPADFP